MTSHHNDDDYHTSSLFSFSLLRMSSSSKRARSRSCRKRCQPFNCSVRVWRSSTHGACHSKKQILAQNSYAYDLGCQSLRSEKVSPVLVLFAFVWQSAGALLMGRHSSTASWASSNWEPAPRTPSSSVQKLEWGSCWNCKDRGNHRESKPFKTRIHKIFAEKCLPYLLGVILGPETVGTTATGSDSGFLFFFFWHPFALSLWAAFWHKPFLGLESSYIVRGLLTQPLGVWEQQYAVFFTANVVAPDSVTSLMGSIFM